MRACDAAAQSRPEGMRLYEPEALHLLFKFKGSFLDICRKACAFIRRGRLASKPESLRLCAFCLMHVCLCVSVVVSPFPCFLAGKLTFSNFMLTYVIFSANLFNLVVTCVS